jgi:hypothetical protein
VGRPKRKRNELKTTMRRSLQRDGIYLRREARRADPKCVLPGWDSAEVGIHSQRGDVVEDARVSSARELRGKDTPTGIEQFPLLPSLQSISRPRHHTDPYTTAKDKAAGVGMWRPLHGRGLLKRAWLAAKAGNHPDV